MNKSLKNFLVILVTIIIIVASFAGGFFVGINQKTAVEKIIEVVGKEPASENQRNTDFNMFWDVWSRLEKSYVDKSKIEPKKLVFGAIAGMVQSLGDPYTVFMPPEEAKRFDDDIKGEFGGIGAEIGIKKGILTIIAPLKDSPAEKAKILAGDKVLKINSTSTADLTLEQAVGFIRGEKGTPVTLTIFNDNLKEPKEVKIIRDTIKVNSIETKKMEDGIFYIHLLNFYEKSTVEFKNALIEMQNAGSRKLILDLRNDPGGYLNAAVEIASWFLPSGDAVAVERGSGGEQIYRSNGYRFLEKTPTVVLINQGSASASEILAGALRDQRQIKLIGQKSFGKGSVQELQKLEENASLKMTIAKWFTPNNHSINDAGLEPDISVEIKQEDLDNNKDPQLDKAVEVLKSL